MPILPCAGPLIAAAVRDPLTKLLDGLGEGGELPVAALEEQQRAVRMEHVERVDLADDDEVVAGLMHGVKIAIDPRDDPVDDRQAIIGAAVATSLNLSSDLEASTRQTCCWLSARTFTQNRPAAWILGQVVDLRSGKNATSGGSSETEVNDPTTIATGTSPSIAGTAQTPVG